MLIWRSETHGGTTIDWFDWKLKWRWVYSVLRDRWESFDVGSLIAAGLVFIYALVSRRLTLSRNLAFSAIVLAAASSCCRGSCSARLMRTCGWCLT